MNLIGKVVEKEKLIGQLDQGVEYYKGGPGPKGDTGPRGEKGEPFRYEDFTPEQLEALRGPQGIQGLTGETGPAGQPGQDGKDGKDFTYDDFTAEQLEALRGPQGEPGRNGSNGLDGKDGKDGVSITHTWNGTSLSITSASGTSEMDLRGPIGPAGQNGSDYVLTEEDKVEIAGMVSVPEVDLSNYYTKTEIDGLLANLPTGDIPSGEEVKF